jgi:GrpB-like predicted nucleotidyltransferase (UPF0157 family)
LGEAMIVVEPYNDQWPKAFESIQAAVWPTIKDVAVTIEHVGSTSVPGLAAKPVIDIDVVIEGSKVLPAIIDRLHSLGYEHRGNLGIVGREAFSAPPNSIRQNFYVCSADSVPLRNHLILRDHLRRDPVARNKYGDLKKKLAELHPDSIDDYIEGKSSFILEILASYGVEGDLIEVIREANRAKGGP